jgi:hypothetical protein
MIIDPSLQHGSTFPETGGHGLAGIENEFHFHYSAGRPSAGKIVVSWPPLLLLLPPVQAFSGRS